MNFEASYLPFASRKLLVGRTLADVHALLNRQFRQPTKNEAAIVADRLTR